MRLFVPALAIASLILINKGRAQEAEATALPAAVAAPDSPKVTPPATPATPLPQSKAAKSGPVTVTVDLINGQRIIGSLTDLGAIPVRASWGPAEIPIPEVAGVKFATSDDPTTTIIMNNGDSITVATDLKNVTVDTEWGQAKINGSAILSMLFIPDLKWTASMGLNGKRWSLVDAKAATPSTTSPSTPGSSSSSSSSPTTASGATPLNQTLSRPFVPNR
ncbi:MAG: hypothetical protein MUC43_07155 [Pirellula sp.]|jgi:hypothetical protein|nr:hypothetical protein [Pirellula sp.]